MFPRFRYAIHDKGFSMRIHVLWTAYFLPSSYKLRESYSLSCPSHVVDSFFSRVFHVTLCVVRLCVSFTVKHRPSQTRYEEAYASTSFNKLVDLCHKLGDRLIHQKLSVILTVYPINKVWCMFLFLTTLYCRSGRWTFPHPWWGFTRKTHIHCGANLHRSSIN